MQQPLVRPSNKGITLRERHARVVERCKRILADRRSGMTLKAIGEKYGFSPTRARELCRQGEYDERKDLTRKRLYNEAIKTAGNFIKQGEKAETQHVPTQAA